MNLKVKMGKKFTDKLREKSHVIIDNMLSLSLVVNEE